MMTKRLTVRLPEDLYERLVEAARLQKLPINRLIMDRLDAAFGLPERDMIPQHYSRGYYYDRRGRA